AALPISGSVFLDRVFDLAGFAVDHGALLLVRYLLVGLVGLLLLAGLLLVGGVHRLAKALDGVAQVRAKAFQALGAEQHDDDEQDDEQLPDADAAESHEDVSELSVRIAGARPFPRARRGRNGAPVRRVPPAGAGRGRRASPGCGTTDRRSRRSHRCSRHSAQRPWRPGWFPPTPRRPFPESCSGPCGTGWPRRSCRAPPACALPGLRPDGSGCRSWLYLVVDGVGVLQLLVHRVPDAVAQHAVEAALAAGVAGDAADLLDLQHDHVGVAVQAQLVELLHMAGFLALAPQLAARARPVDGAAFLDAQAQGFAVHPGHHQDAASLVVLGDRRHQAVGVPADFVLPVFHRVFATALDQRSGLGFPLSVLLLRRRYILADLNVIVVGSQ